MLRVTVGIGLDWMMPVVVADSLAVFLCGLVSFLNGYVKTWVFAHADSVPCPPPSVSSNFTESKPILGGGNDGQQYGDLRPGSIKVAHIERVSRQAALASQMAALSAASTMFICGPVLGLLPS
eukprot:SAG31_NODE_898_length_11146_cov_25.421472_2_plen_123_part_00